MRRRLHRWCPWLLCALFVLAVELVLGAAAPEAGMHPTPARQLAALLADDTAICHGDVGGGQRAPHHRGIGCLLCPYCAAVATAVVLRSDDVAPPIPRAGPIAIAIGASETIFPMPSPRLFARPRGPPILT